MHSGRLVREIKDTGYLFLALVVIMTLFFLLLYNYPGPVPVKGNDHGNNGNPSQNMILPDETLCEEIEYGWMCILNKEGDWFQEGWEEKYGTLNDAFEAVCNEQGGTWNCSGYCLPSYEHYCDFLRKDAGKACTNSSDCSDKCIISFDYIATNYPDREMYNNIPCPECTGTCSEYTVRFCDWYYELNNGIIEDNTGIMCD